MSDSVLSGPQVPWALAGLIRFSPHVPWGLSPFGPPGTLRTGGSQSFQPSNYPLNWGVSVILAPRVSVGLRPPDGLILASH